MLDGAVRPNRKQKHNAKVRARILSAAGEMFRRNGYDGTGIDTLMAGADLTRGAFYAHFVSKEALFVEVLAQEDPLLARLRGRRDRTPAGLVDALEKTVYDLLDPANLRKAAQMSNLIAFSHDAARGTDAMRNAYQECYDATAAEMARGHTLPPNDMRVFGGLAAILSGIQLAQATANSELRTDILIRARQTFGHFSRKYRRTLLPEGVA